MRSAVALAFAAGALAVPYKRDIVTDFEVVYQTDVVTVWANAQPTSSSSVADAAQPAPSSSSSSSAAVVQFGHNHWSYHVPSSQSSTESATPSSTYVAPTTSSTSTPAPVPTTPTSTYVPPPPTSTYVAPTTSSTTPAPVPTTTSTSVWVAPTTSSSSTWVATSSAAASPTSYQEIAVYHHNIHRANHSAPDIAWDSDLEASAKIIAQRCVYEHNVTVNGGGYGQNIAAGVESTNISSIITDLFYNGEVNWYEGLYGQAQPDMTNFEHWGHFSQIVWKATTHVACYTQYCPSTYLNAAGTYGLGNVGDGVSPYFTVCNYKDPGNFANEYGDNVGASLKQATAGWNAGL